MKNLRFHFLRKYMYKNSSHHRTFETSFQGTKNSTLSVVLRSVLQTLFQLHIQFKIFGP